MLKQEHFEDKNERLGFFQLSLNKYFVYIMYPTKKQKLQEPIFRIFDFFVGNQ